MMQSTWAPEGPSRFNITPGPASPVHTELASIASPFEGADAASKPWSPQSPLFWVGAIGLVTFGAMAFSTSVRVGKGTVSLDVGKT